MDPIRQIVCTTRSRRHERRRAALSGRSGWRRKLPWQPFCRVSGRMVSWRTLASQKPIMKRSVVRFAPELTRSVQSETVRCRHRTTESPRWDRDRLDGCRRSRRRKRPWHCSRQRLYAEPGGTPLSLCRAATRHRRPGDTAADRLGARFGTAMRQSPNGQPGGDAQHQKNNCVLCGSKGYLVSTRCNVDVALVITRFAGSQVYFPTL